MYVTNGLAVWALGRVKEMDMHNLIHTKARKTLPFRRVQVNSFETLLFCRQCSLITYCGL